VSLRKHQCHCYRVHVWFAYWSEHHQGRGAQLRSSFGAGPGGPREAQKDTGGSLKLTRYKGLGHPAWLFRSTSAGGPSALIVIKDRQYFVGASVFSSLSKVRLAALADLAEKFYFPLTP
jgi:hypothetical protein